MIVFILVFILLLAVLVIAVLMGVSPASQKVKVRMMYVVAALVLFATPIICNYIDASPTSAPKLQFKAILVFAIAIGYFCVYVACMEKYNVLKRKSRVLEQALTEKEQEKVAAIMEHQNEKQQSVQKEELEWFAGKIKMFCEDEQKAILASAYAFAEHNLILPLSITIQPKEECSQQELMYFVYSAFSNMGKKRSDIVSFLYQVFKAYFPAGESTLSKKLPGLDKVREKREKEKNTSKSPS